MVSNGRSFAGEGDAVAGLDRQLRGFYPPVRDPSAPTPGLPCAGAEGFREIDSNLRKSTAASRSMPSALTRRSNLSNSARASSRYASRKAAADVHAVPAMDGDIEVGRFESAGQMP